MKKGMMCLAILGSMIILLSGCSKDQASQPSKSHPAGWAKGSGDNSHGAKIAASGMVSCTSCHGQDYRGGDAEVSCFECHGSYPHQEGWTQLNASQSHGKYVSQSGYSMKECQACHGLDLKDDRIGKICEDCHVTHFLESKWNSVGDPRFHGANLKNNDAELDKCRMCHGPDLKGGTSKVSCFTCHGTYPHSTDFKNNGNSSEFHGAFLKANDYKTSFCTSCHGIDLQGGTSQVACFTCHASYPHNADWMDKDKADYHGGYLAARAYEMAECKDCHGDNLQGGDGKQACNTCHQSYPHTAEWLTDGSANYHGAYLAGKNFSSDECKTCHGENLQGGTGKQACNACHATYPHSPAFKSETGSSQFHGAYLKTASYNNATCAPCHGTDYAGGQSRVACFTCHTSYPHASQWVDENAPGYHGAYLSTRNFNNNECKSCHGESLQGGDGKQACNSCHATYPHSSTFKNDANNAEFHGPYLKAQGYALNACADCHGSDYMGGSSRASCYTCHGSYPHSLTWNNAQELDSHTGYLRSHRHNLQDCQTCHGSDYRGGTSSESCYACHNSAQGPENCTLCHGSSDNMAPPKDTQGNTSETALGVGRHQFHVADKKYNCQLCHVMPAAFATAGHVYEDNTPGHAEVNSLWQWNSATATCVTGCHANDPNKNYIWNH